MRVPFFRLFFLSFSFADGIYVAAAVFLPRPAFDTLGCRLDQASVLQPDPNQCRERGAEYCCNRLYHDTIMYYMEIEYKHWRIEAQEAMEKHLPAPKEPAKLDFNKLNIFEAQAIRHEPLAWKGSADGSIRIDYFTMFCWLTLPNEGLFFLFPRTRKYSNRRIPDQVHSTEEYTVHCKVQERAEFRPRTPRRQWESSEYPGLFQYPSQLTNARCVPVSEEEWHEYQKVLNNQRKAGEHSTYAQDNDPRLRVDDPGIHTTKRQRVVTVTSNRKVVPPNSVNICADFAGTGIEELAHISPSTYAIPDSASNRFDPQQYSRTQATLSEVLHERDILSARIVRVNNRITGLRKDLNRMQALQRAQAYNDAMKSSEYDPTWDNQAIQEPATAESSPWDYPELYGTPHAKSTVVSQIQLQLVSKNPVDGRQATVIDRTVGPASYLDVSLASSLPHLLQEPATTIPKISEGQHQALTFDSTLQACITTIPSNEPMELWAELLRITGGP